jgi:hypothetical protein
MRVTPSTLALVIAAAMLVSGEQPANAQDAIAPAGGDKQVIRPTPVPGPVTQDRPGLPDARVRLPERSPEPTGVYGWIAIVDPATGQKWLPYLEERDRVGGYPSAINVRFQPILGGSPATVSFRAGVGIQIDPARNAWRYAITLVHVATMTGPPAKAGSAGVRYNPARWRFAGLEMGPYSHDQRRPDGNRRLWTVDFRQRSSAFGDLPDMPP